MKQSHTHTLRSARKSLKMFFVCLFFLHTVSLFHVADAMAGPSLTGASAEMIGGTIAAVAGEHCDKQVHQETPDHGQCHHAGFCPFCSQGERDYSVFGAPPPSLLLYILAPDDEPADRFAPVAGNFSPLPSSSGLDVSRFATAPPRA